MVLVAALSMARFSEWLPRWFGFENMILANVLAFIVSAAVMFLLAVAIERFVLRHLVNQEATTLLMATLGISYFLDGLGQITFGSSVYSINVGMPKDPLMILESVFEGGLLINLEDLTAAVIAALLVAAWRSSSSTPRPAAPCARWPTTTRPRSPSASRSTASGSSSGAWRAWWRWWRGSSGDRSSACSSRCPPRRCGAAGGDPGRPDLGAGRILGGLIIGVGEKLSEVYLGSLVGGGIEIWFAYVLALVFLLFRPQGLFGEKIIDRV